ncbi:hypothetical protein KBY30_10175 [Ruegeria pomeroyi]|nr:hypothetical protein [Ruegeria pomeroyi]
MTVSLDRRFNGAVEELIATIAVEGFGVISRIDFDKAFCGEASGGLAQQFNSWGKQPETCISGIESRGQCGFALALQSYGRGS